MKIGRSLVELAQEIERQKTAKHDYVASSENIRMCLDPVDHPEATTANLVLGNEMRFGLLPLAHEQIAGYTHIPMPYYRRMQKEAPELLCDSVNTWFHKDPQKRMIRTLDGNARAFLSSGYRPLDNDSLLEAVLPPLLNAGVEVVSCEVTQNRLYLKAVDTSINKDIPNGRRMGDGTHTIFDTISPAIIISNSEVGLGALSVQTGVWTRACTNLAVFSERSARKYHIGNRVDVGEEVYRLLSDNTRRLTDAAVWAQMGDVVRGAFDQAKFDALAAKLTGSAEDQIKEDPVKVVEVTAKKFEMTDGEKSSVLQHLIRNGDLSRYGLHAAITRTAEDLENYDRASHFEALGGKVVELERNEWQTILQAAA